MGIKCSLLGHRFTATDTEEEREEQGSEVVITRKEIETCARCGESRVVSENKEVTSLAAEGDTGAPAGEDGAGEVADEAATGTTAGSAAAPDMDAAEEDAELLDAGDEGEDGSASDPVETAGRAGGDPEPATAAGDDDVEVPDDDAVILDDGDDGPERDPGEWPEESEADADEGDADGQTDPETTGSAETRAVDETVTQEEWPDEYGYDEGSDATAEEVSWPEEDEGDGDEWEPSESLTEGIDGADIESAGSTAVTVPDGEFVCTECSFTTLVEESSLRAGDFCPECRRGTLEHRPESETRKE